MANETYHPRGVLVHGYKVREHPLYNVWAGIKSRCNDAKIPAYQYYGARGIGYCDRWKVFANFAEDMWPKPPGTSIERKDNNKGYSPENCVWATPTEQCHNRRTFKNNTVGVTGIVAIERGFNARYNDHSIRYDLGNFDSIEEAINYRDEFIKLYNSNDPKFYTYLTKRNSFRRVRRKQDTSQRRLRRDSRTGVTGITVHEQGYIVRKTINGVRQYLGFSKTFEKAIDLLRAAK